MRTFLFSMAALGTMLASTPALAQDTAPPSALTINGSATLVSDYRFRGISQSDRNIAVQGGLTLTHESGLYAGLWGSSVDDYVTASGQGHQELDLIAGFRRTIDDTTFDIGAVYYVYPKSKLPGDLSSSDFIEPYASVSRTLGPVTAKATVNWAPKQKAMALNQIGPAHSNLYLAGDVSAAIPTTPITLTGHLGHTWGPSWLTIGNEYTDWSIGATANYKALTLGLSYVDASGTFITPSGKDGAAGALVASIGVSF